MTKKSEQQKLQTSAVLLSDTRERERERESFFWVAHDHRVSLSHSFHDDDDSRAKKKTPRLDDREETKKNPKSRLSIHKDRDALPEGLEEQCTPRGPAVSRRTNT